MAAVVACALALLAFAPAALAGGPAHSEYSQNFPGPGGKSGGGGRVGDSGGSSALPFLLVGGAAVASAAAALAYVRHRRGSGEAT